MSPYFYSLGMLVTGRIHEEESPNLSAMDLLAVAISDETQPPHPLLDRYLAARRDEYTRYKCPTCGHGGAHPTASPTPLCHRCDYKVTMVASTH